MYPADVGKLYYIDTSCDITHFLDCDITHLVDVGGGDAGHAGVADDERAADAAAVAGDVDAALLRVHAHKLPHPACGETHMENLDICSLIVINMSYLDLPPRILCLQ